jgi:hypothetical protein
MTPLRDSLPFRYRIKLRVRSSSSCKRTISPEDGPRISRTLFDATTIRNKQQRLLSSVTMASRARQITALVAKQGNTVARRSIHASSLQKAGMTPPLPPFARIPRETGSVRYCSASRNLEFRCFLQIIYIDSKLTQFPLFNL